jgi:hypothetical protein
MHDIERLERWLAAEVFGAPAGTAGPSPSTFLSHLQAAQRMQLLRRVFRQRPRLATASQRLSLYDQLRLSLDLVRVSGQTSTLGVIEPRSRSRRALARCFAQPAGTHGRPRKGQS